MLCQSFSTLNSATAAGEHTDATTVALTEASSMAAASTPATDQPAIQQFTFGSWTTSGVAQGLFACLALSRRPVCRLQQISDRNRPAQASMHL